MDLISLFEFLHRLQSAPLIKQQKRLKRGRRSMRKRFARRIIANKMPDIANRAVALIKVTL